MADDMLNIRVRISGDPQGAKKVQRQIAAIAQQSGIASVQTKKLSGQTGGLNSRLKEWQNNNKLLTKSIGGVISVLGSLGKLTVKFGAIGFGGILLGLSAVSAAFKLGSMVAKAYQATMAGLAAGLAVVVTGLAAFAAAQREATAASNAFAAKSAPALGSGLNQARASLRNLQADSQLASVGIKGLTAAFTAFSKYGSFDAKTQKSLKALDDFASAGGDRAKGIAAAAEMLGKVQKAMSEGKTGLTADIESAGKQLGPTFEKALKEWKKKNKKQTLSGLQASINSGEFARLGGVQGQAEAVNSTVMSILKGYFTQLQVMFADMGQPLLQPLKVAFDDIFKIIRNTLLRVSSDITGFANSSILGSLVGAFEKLSNFFVKMIREYLPQATGMLKGFGVWWGKFVYMWKELTGRLNSAASAGKEVNKMFGGILAYAFKRLGDMIKKTTDLINANPEKFKSLQKSVEKILDGISGLYQFFAQTFIDAAPAIERVVNLFEKLVPLVSLLVSSFIGLFSLFGAPGGFGSLAALVGMAVGGKMAKSAWKGKGGKGGGAGGGMGIIDRARGGVAGRFGTPGAPIIINNAAGATGATGATGAAGAASRSRFKTPWGRGGGSAGGGGTTFIPSPNQGGGAGGGAGQRFITPWQKAKDAGTGMTGKAKQAWQKGQESAEKGKGAYQKGYARNRAQGGGVVTSANRGLRGAYMGATKGGMGIKSGVGSKLGGKLGGFGTGVLIQGIGSRVLDESAQSGVQTASMMSMMGMGPALSMGVGLGVAANKAKTAAGGAMLGAGSGAMLGGMVAGPVGAAIGAALGGIAGGIKGALNKDKAERAKATKQAKDLVMGHANSVLNGMISGVDSADAAIKTMNLKTTKYSQFAGLNQFERKARAKKMGLTGDELADVTQEHFGTYYDELKKNSDDLNAAAKGPLKNYKNRMHELMQLTGKTEPELHALSMQLGVNLYDSTVDLSTAMQQLGQTVDITASGIINASKDIAIKALSAFDEAIAREEAPQIINEAAEKLRQLGEGASKKDFMDFYRTAYEQLMVMNPEASQLEIMDIFKKGFGKGGTVYSSKTGPLGGLGGIAESVGAFDAQKTFTDMFETDQKAFLTSAVTTRLSESNLTASLPDIKKQIDAMTTDQLIALEKAFATGGSLSANITGQAKVGGADVIGEGKLSALGIITNISKMQQTAEEKLTENAAALRAELVKGVTEGFAKNPEWYNTSPAWYTKESFETLVKDTRTPRGGRIGDTSTPKVLGRTMSRHGYLDSMVTGSRAVTSSYRTTGLGSVNSDHVTGRAYDLTGQNLGLYKTAVDSMGGFAEFHGTNSERHLHVVPGPSPIGDMTSPRMSRAAGVQSVAAGGGSVTVNVYGAQGQSEVVIAQQVASILDKRARSQRERI